MNEPDFTAFAALWQQEPAEEEVRIFRKMARRASRRARLLRQAESLAGAVIAGGAAVAFVAAPGLLTGAFAFLLAMVALWTAWQRHLFDEASAQLSRKGREALLESSERSARAALRKSTIGVATALPGGLMAVILADLVSKGLPGSPGDLFLRLGTKPILVSLAIMSLVTLGALRNNLRLRRELARIEALRVAYREEDLLDRAAAHRPSDW